GADRAVQLLKEHGVVRALVDLGGDVYALGTRPDGTPWRLGIRHPRRAGQILGILHVSDAAVATSGDYERYFEYEGVRYSHIVDPRTGWPAMELASVTVVAPHGVWADALSTAVFVLGKEEGLALLESLPGVEGILVDKDLNVLITSGLEGKVDRLEGQGYVGTGACRRFRKCGRRLAAGGRVRARSGGARTGRKGRRRRRGLERPGRRPAGRVLGAGDRAP